MQVKITKDYTYDLDKSARRTLFKGCVYDEPLHLVKDIVEAGQGECDEYDKAHTAKKADTKKVAETKPEKPTDDQLPGT